MTDDMPVISASPVALEVPGRDELLCVRVSAPARGAGLPVVLLSHGFGSSLRAYWPLADFWAGHGFVVIQPTHLDSREVGLPPDDPRRPELWRLRIADMIRILDGLEALVSTVPGLPGRCDLDCVAVAGHSFGGQTASVLLGARVIEPASGRGTDLSDPRVRAGVLLATAGRGGESVKTEAAKLFPWLNADFGTMTAPALVVAGGADTSPLSTRGPDWSADPYRLGPGARALVTLFGAEHSLGGIVGYDAAETTDADPARVAAIQRLTTAFLRSALRPGDPSWLDAVAAFTTQPGTLGRIETKCG